MAWLRRDGTDETRLQIRPEASVTDPAAYWSRPLRCPRCGGPGYLDMIDLVDCTTRQHCPDCRHAWETAAGPMAAASR